MKKILSVAGLIATTLAMSVAVAAAGTLWDNQTFLSADFPVVSAEIDNSSNPKNSVRVIVSYEDLTPDDVGYPGIVAVLEQEISTGVWVEVATQNQAYRLEGNAPTRIIEYGPRFVANPGEDLYLENNSGGIRQSVYDGRAASKLRVRLLKDGSVLTSATVSGYFELFDY